MCLIDVDKGLFEGRISSRMGLKLESYSDVELIDMIKQDLPQKNEAFAVIYKRYSVSVNTYCRSMIHDRDSAKDIFQETFIRFFNNLKNVEHFGNVNAYLIATAKNLCLNCIRDRKDTVPFDILEMQLKEVNNYDNNEMMDLIVRSLELLDVEYREAFIMKEFQGLSMKEIADLQKTSLPNAKSRVLRAKRKIIDILEPYIKDLNRIK
jgi:RNA polymerase sigma-70 factor, ECF subfamily